MFYCLILTVTIEPEFTRKIVRFHRIVNWDVQTFVVVYYNLLLLPVIKDIDTLSNQTYTDLWIDFFYKNSIFKTLL